MNQEFQFKGVHIPYKIDYNNRKHCYISIKEGQVIVKAPLYMSKTYISKILLSKGEWILKKLEEQDRREAELKARREEGFVSIFGKDYKIRL